MATITTQAYSGRSLTLDVWEGTTDIANNRRLYGWRLYGSGSGGGYIISRNFYVAVGDQVVYNSAAAVNLYGGTVIAEGSVWVYHEASGGKQINMYCQGAIYTNAVNVSASGAFWATGIPRYANLYNFNWEETSLTSVRMSFKTDNTIAQIQYSINNGSWVSVNGSKPSSTWYYNTLSNLEPGTTYTIKTRIQRSDSGLWTESGNITVTTHNIAKITSAVDFTDESNGYIKFTNPSLSKLNLKLKIGNDYIFRNNIDGSSGEYTILLTTDERELLRNNMKNTNNISVEYILLTIYNNEERWWDIVTKNISIVNAKPVLSSFNYQDTNNTTVLLTGSIKTIVKGQSNVRIYGVSADTLKYATKKNIVIDNTVDTWVESYQRTFNKYSKSSISASIVDSRDNTSNILGVSFTKFIDYLDITKESQSLSRNNQGVGEEVTIVAKGSWFNGSFGTTTNTITGIYRYRKSGATTWNNGTSALNISKVGNTFSINQIIKGDTVAGFDIQNSYDIEIILTDKIMSITISYILISGSPALAIVSNKISLGGNLDESSSYDVQIKKDVNFEKGIYMNNKNLERFLLDIIYPVGSVYFTNKVGYNPGTTMGGTWARIPDGYIRSRNYGNLTTGGSWDSGSTVLNITQTPSHVHNVATDLIHVDGIVVNKEYINTNLAAGSARRRYRNYEESVGGNQGHTHTTEPPFVSVIGWVRTV